MLREATKDLGRLRDITRIIGKYGYGRFFGRSGDPDVSKDLKSTVPKNGTGADVGETEPRRFRRMLEELGPTFIKLGQVLSSRPDQISPRYSDELKILQYQCEPLAFAQIERAIEEG